MQQKAEEMVRQNGFPFTRGMLSEYHAVLGYYQVQSCLEYASLRLEALDLACGDGLLTSMLAPHFGRVVGVDASSARLVEARARLPNVEFHEGLIETIKLDNNFDVVFMLNVLEHVQDPVLVLRKAADMLMPNGVLIIHVPNSQAVNRKIAVLMGTLSDCEELSPFDVQIVGHRRSYHLSSLKLDIARAGLRVQETGGVFYKALSTPQMDWLLRTGPWSEGEHGWGRSGSEKSKDWRAEFCRACYEYGKEHPQDCNIISAVVTR